MKWMDSKGGPLILLPAASAARWGGVRGGDYELACDVDDVVGVVASAAGDVVVLGDEPLTTTWVPTARGGKLVGCVYADSEASLENAAAMPSSADLPDTGIRLQVAGDYWLVDSADPGSIAEVRGLAVKLQPGTYRIHSGTVDVGDQVRLLIHAIERAD